MQPAGMTDLVLRPTSDRETIEAFLRRDSPLHLYEIGDLDPLFWPKTTWYGAWSDAREGREVRLRALALRYEVSDGDPVLLLLERTDVVAAQWLAARLSETLTEPLYGHLTLGLEEAFAARGLRSGGHHAKMTLARGAALPEVEPGIRRLTAADLPAMRALYDDAYPGNWFDPAMVATEQYFGGFDGAQLRAVAGVHVFAPNQRVAALGNITTHPGDRGRGWGRAVTVAVCRSLQDAGIEFIGLNVRTDNAAAIACYRRIGFEHDADYIEWNIGGVTP